jgi:hypothetical protein
MEENKNKEIKDMETPGDKLIITKVQPLPEDVVPDFDLSEVPEDELPDAIAKCMLQTLRETPICKLS